MADIFKKIHSAILGNSALLIAVCLIFFIFFKVTVALIPYSQLDDWCYLKFAAKTVGEELPGCIGSDYPPGVMLLWFPAAISAKIVAFFIPSVDFSELLAACVGVLSYFYWGSSLFILHPIFKRNVFLTLIISLSVPVLYYSTERTTMTHSSEWFLVCALAWTVLRKRLFPAILFSVVLTALRINDFPALFLPIGLYLDQKKPITQKTLLSALSIPLFILAAILVFFSKHGYHSSHLSTWIGNFTFSRIGWVFGGADWGLFFTALPLLTVNILGLYHLRKLSNIGRACILWAVIELAICIGWKGNGSDFGYRYLIGSYVSLVVLCAGDLKINWGFKGMLLAQSLFNCLLLIFYKVFDDTTPTPTEGMTWTQPQLLLNTFSHMSSQSDWAYWFQEFLGWHQSAHFNSSLIYSFSTVLWAIFGFILTLTLTVTLMAHWQQLRNK